mgnify:CR=1 FL=1
MTFLVDGEGQVRPGWRAFGFLVALLLLLVVTTGLLSPWIDARQNLLGAKAVELGAVLGLTWLCLRGEDASWATLGLRAEAPFWRELGLGAAWGAGLQLAAAGLLLATGMVSWVPGDGTPGGLAWVVALFAVVALHEELLFRGYPFQRFVQGLGYWPAQVLYSGLMFAALHLGNPNQGASVLGWSMANIALAGLLFGAMWRATGRLGLAVGAHFAWNLTQGPLLGFGVSGNALPSLLRAVPAEGRPVWMTGGAFGLEATLVCALACGGALVWFATRPPASGD